MKISKISAIIAAAAMAVSMMAVNVSASSTVLDFEDGQMNGVSMKTDDGGDVSVLSVADFNGSKMLKVDVQDKTLIPKVYFDLNTILGDQKFDKVAKITMDVIIESKDGTTPPGWAGGAIGTQGGEAATPGWGQSSWDGGEYEKGVSAVKTIERKFLIPAERLVNGTADTHMLFMRWAAADGPDYNIYLDNVTFFDDDGNAIELATAASAPAADTTTTSAETGNASVAAIAAVMAIAGAAAVASKKKN